MRKLLLLMIIGLLLSSPVKVQAATNDEMTMYVTARSGLNVRKEASTESEKLSVLSYNQLVYVIDITDNWALITYNNDYAYVSAGYLSAEQQSDSTLTYIGTFTVTYYCPCVLCCGWSTGITASGTIATVGRTIGVDPSVIPLGTHVMINGLEYVAEDTGGSIVGNRIDLFVGSHQEALSLGVSVAEVYKVEQ